ncbi:hypothetical protein IFM89_008037 [Coptis chinensis]|uniref:Uncharacterized protein n=1 Tax=Coptis chinensis TaxID=261450 RepID=A0A835HUL2_9MAGN|nr:hypothetical protein IFM89_008037 [Coptis chinensis]
MPMTDFSSNLQEGLWWNNTPPPKSPSSEYKGVIPQPNGRWGAQIYDNQHRVWLGTFDTQEAAVHTYDQALAMFRGTPENYPIEDHSHSYSHSTPQESITDDMDEDVEEVEEAEKEYMFEKSLTPSDVGKLNRLVIPKQHAEKYFPLQADTVEKGLLLSFEDESRKIWRFRYSYWNSSQSYVLTKGWSRFVKEKKLDAGDVVSFQRRRFDRETLYIRWRRRNAAPTAHDSRMSQSMTAAATNVSSSSSSSAWTRVYYSAQHPYPSHQHNLHGPLSYQPDCLHAAEPVEQNPVTMKKKKPVRVFGVDLADCQRRKSQPSGPDNSSSLGQDRANYMYSHGHDLNLSIQQDFSFSQQMRNYPGGSGDMPT